MEVATSVLIQAPRAAVWKRITDIEHAPQTISGIEKVEILERPASGLVGLKWKETRTMFGKTATETMWITDAVEPEFYKTRAESHGAIYVGSLELAEKAAGAAGLVERRVRGDLERFKDVVESGERERDRWEDDGGVIGPEGYPEGTRLPSLSRLRGMEVRTTDGHRIGKVQDVYLDADARYARYLSVKTGWFSGSHVVPVDESERVRRRGRLQHPVVLVHDERAGAQHTEHGRHPGRYDGLLDGRALVQPAIADPRSAPVPRKDVRCRWNHASPQQMTGNGAFVPRSLLSGKCPNSRCKPGDRASMQLSPSLTLRVTMSIASRQKRNIKTYASG